MRALVIGGTGSVGRRAAVALRDRGAAVRVLSRAPADARLPTGVEAVAGDVTDPATLAPAFDGVDGVVLILPATQGEVEAALHCLAAAARAGARRIVYVSAAGVEAARGVALLDRKAAIENEVRRCGAAFTLIRPGHYYQNDIPFAREIAELGVYPLPIGHVGVSRSDTRDVARAAAAALLEPGHAGRVYSLAGPDELTGDDVAAVYARHLGRPVRYTGDDVAAWSARVEARLPTWQVAELLEVYVHFQAHGALASDAGLAAARRLIGHPLRTFEEFVAEVAPRWRR